jgi:hypothetical protein
MVENKSRFLKNLKRIVDFEFFKKEKDTSLKLSSKK